MLSTWDIVVVSDQAPDVEIRGLRGHICSAVDPDQVGVFLDEPERVWCLHPDDVIPTGETLPLEDRPGGAAIRVNQRGEIVD